ncbi:GNAT family N-acetyltransferase [Niabella beijingensis]|uniref:GNAT family N-acetyltransferase n=1 Tax=Niabella beijingensis TaxID=2872700 RepID=UPI001CBE3246|nr:GNAT family N-acetyltransferase [Niabella beijingensis]MBZ4191597.1 GNAT family N-acetyltransferase [Niabella beijingensis]
MEIRQIRPHEVALVVRLFDQYRVFYKQASDLQRAQQFLETRLNNNESVIFAAFADITGEKHPVGFTQLYPTYSSVRTIKNWILNDLFVQDVYRKNGIGEALIRRALHFAIENGAHFLQLETATDNINAQKLYEKIGFLQQQPGTEFLLYRCPLV